MRGLRLYDYPPRGEYDGVIVIHKGLSVDVLCHHIDLVRDESARTAIVRVTVVTGYTPTGLERVAVKTAADMLATRARRLLGHKWTVVEWEQPGEALAPGA